MRIVLLLLLALGVQAESVLLECEQFVDRGGWAVDSQFMDQMGSTFLLAHGMGAPVADATTTFAVAQGGVYDVWAYTRNWTAPWSEHAAGVFRVAVNGKELGNALGTGTGEWRWQKAGTVTLAAGTASVALHDLTGFDGRCDAVCFTAPGTPPPARGPHRPDLRAPELSGIPSVSADFVVCGGGIAGTCAAISAARLGLKVALVQDRPMLGGANSSEVRVHLGGYQNLGPYPRLGDVVAEIGPAKGGNARPAANYEDRRKLDAVAAEKNISLHLNTRVIAAEKVGDRIAAVLGRDVISGKLTRFAAPLFADCTGDGAVGVLAGADFRMGRESKAETGEEMAPETADKMTMGASVQWYTKELDGPAAFPSEPWMIPFNEQNCEHGTRGDWDWETGMMRDQIAEFERIRDYGMLVVYSNWSFLKNRSAKKDQYAKRVFEWVAYVAGKRESRRLMGDHVLCQQDVFDKVPYPDGTCCTTWAIDLHYPMPRNVKNYDGEPFRSICTHNMHEAYPIPYRCLYSRNVANLFMAGRNISVTHVALGTTRVMRTTGMMGEVVGMAARVCRTHDCLPRGVYAQYLDELKALMAKGVGTGAPQPPQNYNRGALRIPKTNDCPTCAFEAFVPMADGVRLYTFGVRPPPGVKCATIVQRNPYVKERKEDLARLARGGASYLKRGYAFVVQHCRGAGLSEGRRVPYESERADGLAFLAWVRRQPWYNGEIFLEGGSYLSSVHWAYLDTNPPDVKGAALAIQEVNRYNVLYRNGFFKVGLHGGWFLREYCKTDHELPRNKSARLTDFPLAAFSTRYWGRPEPAFDNPLRHPLPSDPYWTSTMPGSGAEARQALLKSTMPVLLRTAFYDIFTEGLCDMWRELPASRRANCALLIDAYDHGGRPRADVRPGATDHFPGGARADEHVDNLAWFDAIRAAARAGRPFAGVTNAPANRTRYYALWENAWKTEPQLYDGARRVTFPLGVGEASFVYDPKAAPPPFPGSGGIAFGGMREQPSLEGRKDAATFLLPPVAERLDVRGRATAKLVVRSDCADTAFYVRLSVDKGDGRFLLLRDDIQSLHWGANVRTPYVPGTERTLSFTFPDHAFRLVPGDRLRVDVASACGAFAPHPNVRAEVTAEVGPERVRTAHNVVVAAKSSFTLPALPPTNTAGLTNTVVAAGAASLELPCEE